MTAPEESAHTLAEIEKLVRSDRVVLFMKGTRAAPACGFSATVVSLLDQYVPNYTTVDVLQDPTIRDGVKQYANWPTIPQLYVNGEFIGGCDIVRQLDEQGELVLTLGDAASPPAPPALEITPKAAEVFAQALLGADTETCIRLNIDAGFHHDLSLEPKRLHDVEVNVSGIRVVLDPGSAHRASGLVIDYVEVPQAGFKMMNPNAPASVQQLTATEAKAFLEREPAARFLDVRTPAERERAAIAGSTLLTEDNLEELLALPKDTPLVFHCHHGIRSHAAATHFLEQGFFRVYNVVGGIDAWSREVDASVPTY